MVIRIARLSFADPSDGAVALGLVAVPDASAQARFWLTQVAGVFYTSQSLNRSLRNKSSKGMAFPHPQSRKDHYRKEDIPSREGIVRKFFKRTIDVTEYRNAEDDVNPAENRTFVSFFHVSVMFRIRRNQA